jgi:DNA recombination protein RmuC
MDWIALLIGLIVGLLLGAVGMRLLGGGRAPSMQAVEARMREAFEALAHQALASNSDQLLSRSREQLEALLKQVRGDWGTHKEELKGLVDPLAKGLDAIDQHVRVLEQKREGAYQSLGEQLRSLGDAQSKLRESTTRLEQSLRSSTARGRWGELQLRRVVELAGLSKHIDFSEQVTGEQGRPDMVVHLSSGGILPIDAKTPAAAYLDAVELVGSQRDQKMAEHAKAMRARVQELARKAYVEQFEKAPEIVVMFVPYESALSAAFEADKDLLEYGISNGVLPASPVTLLALLRAAAFGWQQYEIAENARLIAEQGRELYGRFLNVLKPVCDAGKSLGKAVADYNRAIGSFESRLRPQLERFRQLTVSSADVPAVEPIDETPRLPLEADAEASGD